MADAMVMRARCGHGAVRSAAIVGYVHAKEWAEEAAGWADSFDEVTLEEARRSPIGCAVCVREKQITRQPGRIPAARRGPKHEA